MAALRIGFRGRLMTAMVALVAVVSLSIGALLMLYLFEDEKARATEQLGLGERVSEELLKQRTILILSRLDVVVRDFGFRAALASQDRPTANSALENQRRRLGAGSAVVIDGSGNLLANSGDSLAALPDRAEALNLMPEAQANGFASSITVIGDQAMELIVLPVEAPGLRATMIAGFELGQEAASIIQRLSGTEALFRAQVAGENEFRFLSDTDHIDSSRLTELSRMTAGQPGSERFVESSYYFTRIISLADGPDTNLQLILLVNRDASLQAYYERAVEIILLVAMVLLLAAIIALFVARGLGKPVLQLARYAKAIGDGKSPKPPTIKAGGELAELHLALGDMLGKLKDREAQIHYAASHDEVTGLPNNNAFLNAVREVFKTGRSFRLFGIRVNDLSNVNDTLGLAFGDKVLCAVAQRLLEKLPDNAKLARTGGGEFLMLADIADGAELDELAKTLLNAAQAPLNIDNTPFSLRCVMASLELPNDARNTDQVRRRTNLTFELAQNNRQQLAYYQPGRDEGHLRELQIISDLNTAITDKGLHMNYQPKLTMADGELLQVEALVRWIHPDLGFISPDEFIFLAEQSGQINDLTRHVLRKVAQDASHWHTSGLEIGVAINLSALDLTRPGLISDVTEAFAGWRLPMSRITLEVTESAVMDDPELALDTLKKLREMGVTLSVDDFGTGYSSLSQLRKLPVQELKIDKSFVLNLNDEPHDQLIVKSTIEMAHGLGLKVVAEGIENNETWHLLKSWGCEIGQGYYMGRPVGASDVFAAVAAIEALKPELNHLRETIL